jgi:hypothetical protein
MSKAKTETGKRLASSLVAGWFLTISLLLVLEGGSFTNKAFGQERMVFVLVGTILLGGLIFCLARMVPFMERISLSIAALLLAGISFAYYPNLFYLIGILVALALVSLYVFSDGKKREKSHIVSEPPNKLVKIWIWILGVFFVIFVGGLTTLRYLNFFTPNFDFGLFCNMFYNMSEGFVPLVTSERDRLLSHFAVHISPIYYLFASVLYALSVAHYPANRAGGGFGKRSCAFVPFGQGVEALPLCYGGSCGYVCVLPRRWQGGRFTISTKTSF